MVTTYLESKLREQDACLEAEIQAGDGWLQRIEKGQILRIVDVCGNQAADTLFISADDTATRYSVQQTLQRQRNALVGVGTELMSNDDQVMLKVVADTCGDHDTLGSACSCESNQIRYALGKRYMHACRDTFLKLALAMPGMDKRDLVNNLNFFMYVPLDAEGNLNFADGISAAGKYIELEAMMNVYVLISNCPQLNNPCNGYNPTPVKVLIWDKSHV